MKILVLVLVVLFSFSCITTEVKVPEGCENSLYYKYYGEFKVGTILIKGGVNEFVLTYPEYQEETLAGLDDLERLLSSPAATYAMLGMAILSDVKWIQERAGGRRIVLVGELVEIFIQDNLYIDSCDRTAFKLEVQKLKYYAGG